MNPHYHTVVNGIAGVSASLGAVLTTFQTQLEWWIRVSGGILGILVALITIYNLLRKK
jgi:hypothetical protein